jgi:cell division protein FtsI (penicillin-binding protein 3)
MNLIKNRASRASANSTNPTNPINSGHRYSTRPFLSQQTPAWRSHLVLFTLAMGFMGLSVQAVYIQVFHRSFYQKQGQVRFARTLDIPAGRGRIVDRNGLILASSIPLASLWVSPEEWDTQHPSLRRLAQLLGLSWHQLQQKIADEDKTFVWLKRQIPPELAKEIMALHIPGVYSREEFKRQYPEGEAFAQVVGMTNTDNMGESGLEKTFDKYLSGIKGSRHVIKNRLGQVVEETGPGVASVDGQDLVLSLDSKVQFFAYQQLRDAVQTHKAKSGSVVVLDVRTGEILAMTNYPSFNPNTRENLSFMTQRNSALVDMFEPGSTMKPLVMGLALDKALVTPQTPIQTAPGHLSMAGAVITDAHPHGVLTASQIIQKSSNVGIVKIAMQLSAKDLWQWYSSLGLGQKPDLPFPGIVAGRLYNYTKWRPINQATMSYGYGLSASLFQLAHAYAVLGNEGQWVPSSLLKVTATPQAHPLMKASQAQAVRQMLKLVTQAGGTAPKAQPVGYVVGGKTGTTHKQEGHGYADRKYRGFFVGLAPIEQPRIAVAVMIDEPSAGQYFGGDVAAPVFRETVQNTLRILAIPPDLALQPNWAASTEEESF